MAYKLEIPLDASGIENFKPVKDVKVVLADQNRALQSQTVKLSKEGRAAATFNVQDAARPTRVIVGPADATDEEILGLQTLTVPLSPGVLRGNEIKLQPVIITPYFWNWWLFWCRTFTIHGRLLCPDGRPVPGAQVCAYDVDFWWWWFSEQLLGCATTDAQGAFTMTFRWCCGWWPWWWWRTRYWQLEKSLADKIGTALGRDARFLNLVDPKPKPDLSLFDAILSERRTPAEPKITSAADKIAALANMEREGGRTDVAAIAARPFDPAVLGSLRERLLKKLPVVPEIDKLKIWPWFPWNPWWDCNPDVVFRATQNCQNQNRVVLEGGIFNVHWNVPTDFTTTLVANENACCFIPEHRPEGNCVDFYNVCYEDQLGYGISDIGGNLGAPPAAATRGYLDPNGAGTFSARPFAGTIRIFGNFGTGASVDFYALEHSDDNGVTWQTPLSSAGTLYAEYYTTFASPGPFGEGPGTHFKALNTPTDTRIIETREHYQATHGAPAGWAQSVWTGNKMYEWVTDALPEATYLVRVRGWSAAELAASAPGHILPLCGTQQDNQLVLKLDNRNVGAGFHIVPSHVCSPPVHLCTREPDTHIMDVRLLHNDGSETALQTCSSQQAVKDTDRLQIDFYAYDAEGHLAYYELYALYGDSQFVPILGAAGSVLVAGAPVGPDGVPSAAQVGPDYATAQTQAGFVRPIWTGGALRITIPARSVFPETCCYMLVLAACKRTLVDCGGTAHCNTTEKTLNIVV